jgi:ATP-dependent Clp protease protease subunit
MAAIQQPPVPPEIYVSFSAPINGPTTEALLAAMANISNQGIPRVTLCMSTPGGAVMCGLNLYHMLKAFPFELITHNVGNVDSIGNAVFLAGEKRYACPNTTFMFHGVSFTTEAGKEFGEKLLTERLEGVVADQKRIGAVLEERTTLTSSDIEPLFLEAKTKDPDYAKCSGIIDDIKEVQIPPGVPVISLVFQS